MTHRLIDRLWDMATGAGFVILLLVVLLVF